MPSLFFPGRDQQYWPLGPNVPLASVNSGGGAARKGARCGLDHQQVVLTDRERREVELSAYHVERPVDRVIARRGLERGAGAAAWASNWWRIALSSNSSRPHRPN